MEIKDSEVRKRWLFGTVDYKVVSMTHSYTVGLGAVLLDIPFDIMGVKLLWWTWHDDDPNIFDRHYWVPWTSYYFHAAFSSSLVLVFHGVRAICCRREFKFQSSG